MLRLYANLRSQVQQCIGIMRASCRSHLWEFLLSCRATCILQPDTELWEWNACNCGC